MDVRITVNGNTTQVPRGISLAGALYLLEERSFRITPRGGEIRSLFCGMGVCYDCVVKVDGRANIRACKTEVRDNMQVLTQEGEADLEDFA